MANFHTAARSHEYYVQLRVYTIAAYVSRTEQKLLFSEFFENHIMYNSMNSSANENVVFLYLTVI